MGNEYHVTRLEFWCTLYVHVLGKASRRETLKQQQDSVDNHQPGEEREIEQKELSLDPTLENEMALQFALNRLFVVTANLGSVFENVSNLSL